MPSSVGKQSRHSSTTNNENGQSAGEFAGRTLCTSLSNLPNLTGTERALLACVEKMVVELNNLRKDMEVKDRTIFELTQQNEALQLELDWNRTELARKEGVVPAENGKNSKSAGETREEEATPNGPPAIKRIKRELREEVEVVDVEEMQPIEQQPVKRAKPQMIMDGESSQSQGSTPQKKRHQRAGSDHRNEHQQQIAGFSDGSNSNENNAQMVGQEMAMQAPSLAIQPYSPHAQQQQFMNPMFFGNFPMPIANQPFQSPPQQLQQQVNKVMMKALASPPAPQKSEKQRTREKERNKAYKAKKRTEAAQRKKDDAAAAGPSTSNKQKIDLNGMNIGECFLVLDKHKTKHSPLFVKAAGLLEKKISEIENQNGKKMNSKQLKRMTNGLMLQKMLELDWKAFWAELKK